MLTSRMISAGANFRRHWHSEEQGSGKLPIRVQRLHHAADSILTQGKRSESSAMPGVVAGAKPPQLASSPGYRNFRRMFQGAGARGSAHSGSFARKRLLGRDAEWQVRLGDRRRLPRPMGLGLDVLSRAGDRIVYRHLAQCANQSSSALDRDPPSSNPNCMDGARKTGWAATSLRVVRHCKECLASSRALRITPQTAEGQYRSRAAPGRRPCLRAEWSAPTGPPTSAREIQPGRCEPTIRAPRESGAVFGFAIGAEHELDDNGSGRRKGRRRPHLRGGGGRLPARFTGVRWRGRRRYRRRDRARRYRA